MVEYDVVVIGGGVNGLATAAYLAKAGAKVAVFEARHEVGTYCDTEEVMRPGVRVNLHAVGMLPQISPAYEELELERFGYETLIPQWQFFYPFKDGSAYLHHIWDAQKTYEIWRKFSERDAQVFKEVINYFGPAIHYLAEGAWFTKPEPESYEFAKEVLGACPVYPDDVLDITGFELIDLLLEDEKLKTAILSLAISTGHDPWERGVGPVGITLAFIFGPALSYTLARGGSHALTHALVRCLVHYGGEVHQCCPVEKILIKDGKAIGIKLSEDAIYPGKEVMAKKAVISDLTPVPTFLWLVGEEHLPSDVIADAKMYDYEGQVLFATYFLLNEPLEFKAFDFTDSIDPDVRKEMTFFNFGAESVDDYHRLHKAKLHGRLPDPPMCHGLCHRFTALDPSQTPEGLHTAQVWADVIYSLRYKGGPQAWDDIREEYADKVTDVLAEYAPNVKTALVDRFAHTPLDSVRKNQSMLRGTWCGGALKESQWGYKRPFPSIDAPRTPIENLYITEVNEVRATILVQGYVTAVEVAKDLGIRNQPWWTVRPIEPWQRLLERRGYGWNMRVE
jgi:phytoene dehydrogenase-like protein